MKKKTNASQSQSEPGYQYMEFYQDNQTPEVVVVPHKISPSGDPYAVPAKKVGPGIYSIHTFCYFTNVEEVGSKCSSII